MSVTDRSHRDLAKRFDELDIDWGVIENQLVVWSHLLRDRRQLRIDISFIYKKNAQQAAVRTQQTTRRGGVTATQLAERAELLEEQEAAGLTTVWKEVYSLMRCTGPPCQGTYCWWDPQNSKHYKLDTSVLTKLVDYAEEGNTLRTHGDVPPWIRELIYAKEQQDSERRKRKRQGSFSETSTPIHITNVIPARCNHDAGSKLSQPSPSRGRGNRSFYHRSSRGTAPPRRRTNRNTDGNATQSEGVRSFTMPFMRSDKAGKAATAALIARCLYGRARPVEEAVDVRIYLIYAWSVMSG